MPLLNTPLPLHDLRDTEALCTNLIRNTKHNLNHQDQEDLLAYLIAEAWELSRKYRPGTRSFTAYATDLLKLRIESWNRSPLRGGRTTWKFKTHTYQRPQPDITSLDQLATTHPERLVDTREHRTPTLTRLHRTRDRSNDRPYPQMGQDPNRHAA
jgi:hypothetical protein